MEGQYNTRSPAVKRLMREAIELKDATSDYYAQPLPDNLFEWHFTVRGPSDTEFEGGVYHGRIILPTEYPMKPPHIIVLTPNGRFEVGKKICLSISGHHPESWQPSWSIRTALLAIIGFMPTPGQGTIGSLDYPKSERIKLAKKSVTFVCPECNDGRPVAELLKTPDPEAPSITEDADLKKIVSNVVVKAPAEDKPVSKREAYLKKRREASIAAQAKFREKLLSRTPDLVKQAEQARAAKAARAAAAAASPPQTSSADTSTARKRATTSTGGANNQLPQIADQGHGADGVDVRIGGGVVEDVNEGPSTGLVEILVGLIALVIGAVLYRRSTFFQKLLFNDEFEEDDELEALGGDFLA